MPDTQKIALARTDEKLSYVIRQVDKLMDAIAKLVEHGTLRDQSLSTICAVLEDLPRLDKRVKTIEDEVAAFRPWIHGLRWFTVIAAGIIVAGIVVGILWATMQAGGGLP